MALTGATTGQVGYLKIEASANQSVTGILPSKEHHPRYLYYYLRTLKRKIQSDAFGGAQPHINQQYVKDIKIPLPSLDNQVRIAGILSRAEGLIEKRKKSVRLLDEFLKSTFLEMFGDPVRNEKGWEKEELIRFGKISTGNTPPRKNPENYSSKYIEWVKTDNILSDRIYVSIATEYLSAVGVEKGRIIDNGALLVACIAVSIDSIGRSALTNRTIAFNQQINAIQPNKEVNSQFLYVLFKISKKYIQSHAAKGMKKILSKGDFVKIKMIKPPVSLQNEFASIVDKIEAIKNKYLVSLEELERLYGSLSQRGFKGELDLSGMNLE